MQVVYTLGKDGSVLIVELIGPGIHPRWGERL